MDLRPLLPHIGPLLIVLSRVTGLFVFAPVLSSSMIPMRIKALLALAITAAAYPVLYPAIGAQSPIPLPVSLLELGPMIAFEMLVGVAIGFLASLPMLSTELGGLIVGQQLGLGFARVYNPAMESDADVIGQMLFYMALCVFIGLGGLEIIFSMLLNTFGRIPPGEFRITEDFVALIAALLTSAFELAVRIAAPVLCLIFLESFALGFMNKTAPAFNILSLGFPIRIILGTIALIASLGAINEGVLDQTGDVLNAMADFFRVTH